MLAHKGRAVTEAARRAPSHALFLQGEMKETWRAVHSLLGASQPP